MFLSPENSNPTSFDFTTWYNTFNPSSYTNILLTSGNLTVNQGINVNYKMPSGGNLKARIGFISYDNGPSTGPDWSMTGYGQTSTTYSDLYANGAYCTSPTRYYCNGTQTGSAYMLDWHFV
jgi:hypothetical protein